VEKSSFNVDGGRSSALRSAGTNISGLTINELLLLLPMSDPWENAERFTGADFKKRSFGDCVYGWFRGEDCLYIGCSGQGFKRVLDHNKIDVEEPVEDNDELRFLWVESGDTEELLTLESILIEHYAPKYNGDGGYRPVKSDRPLQTIRCKNCMQEFTQKYWWQKVCRKNCKPQRPTREELLALYEIVMPEQQPQTKTTS
jgi:hypothetical protein